MLSLIDFKMEWNGMKFIIFLIVFAYSYGPLILIKSNIWGRKTFIFSEGLSSVDTLSNPDSSSFSPLTHKDNSIIFISGKT